MQQSPAVSAERPSLPINHSVKALTTKMSQFVVLPLPGGCGNIHYAELLRGVGSLTSLLISGIVEDTRFNKSAVLPDMAVFSLKFTLPP